MMKEELTSRQRVIAAMNHKQPDLVPLSIGSSSNDQFTRVALQNYAREYPIGDYDEIVTWKTVQTVITPPQIQMRYNADMRMILPGKKRQSVPGVSGPGGRFRHGCPGCKAQTDIVLLRCG